MPPSTTTTKTKKIMSFLDLSMEDLPEPVIVDILSRLPVKTIIQCKCVCKKWLDLISDSYFANLHLSRSPSGVIIYFETKANHSAPGILKWMEVEDELDHHLLHRPVMSLDLNLSPIFQNTQILAVGSVNGLICLWQYGPLSDNTHICNPITREYMILPRQQYYREGVARIVYCFGVSSHTREYKVIRIFQRDIDPYSTSTSRPSLSEAEVYTLGTCKWRRVGHVPYFLEGFYGPFLNGHAHWIVVEKNSPNKLCAFDFDKETFELFPSPPSEAEEESQINTCVGVLKGCLCRCDTYESKWTVWVMKEYGIKKSWRKEFVIKRSITPNLSVCTLETMSIIERFQDGTILMASYLGTLLVYCPRRETFVDKEIINGYYVQGFNYRLGFHRLQNFENERVQMF